MRLKTLLTIIGLSAGTAYYYDPQQGGGRRVELRDKAMRLRRQADQGLAVGVQDLRNRTRGVLAELSARAGGEQAADWVLEERVRARLGAYLRRPGLLEVRARDGIISLSGPALRQDAEALVQAARRTRGVRGVENNLQPVDSPEQFPATGLGAERGGPRREWQQQNWSPAMRLLAGGGGGLLALYGMARRGLLGPALSLGGLFLAARAVTNMDPRTLLGLGLGENAIRVHKAINIHAPVDELYRFWSNFENFPQFMSHVQAVRTENGVSEWTVKGPAGAPVTFKAEKTRDVPNESIAWQTLPDSQVQHTGFVRFDENRDGSTRVTVQMRYVPPAGVMGHAAAKLFGVDPKQAMDDDLARLKGLLEKN